MLPRITDTFHIDALQDKETNSSKDDKRCARRSFSSWWSNDLLGINREVITEK